jgi:tRNA-splicing ligase RtcB
MKTHQAPNGRWYRAWTEGVLWEPCSQDQVHRLLELAFIKEVAVMPDTHFGMGGPIGVAVKFGGAIIPSVIGVDIGCGMRAVLTDLVAEDLTPDILPALRQAIESVVPHGLTRGADKGSWGVVPEDIKSAWHHDNEFSLAEEYEELLIRFERDWRNIPMTHESYLPPLRNGQTAQHRDPLSQLGTLGTGNHFFEVSVDQQNRVWCVVHSGSRGAGARIGDYFTKRAQDLMVKWLVKLPGDDRNLAFLPEGEPEYNGYIAFMKWAQKYAWLNRSLMMTHVLNIAFTRVFKGYANRLLDFDIHHNYLDTDTLIARKGAVHLTQGQFAVIPGAMGARTYIVTGLPGLSASMETCSHGAGRAMSRTQAIHNVTLEQHQTDLAGLECDKSEGTLDETTRSYKNIDAVIAAQADLVKTECILNAKLCVKGVGELRRRK